MCKNITQIRNHGISVINAMISDKGDLSILDNIKHHVWYTNNSSTLLKRVLRSENEEIKQIIKW